MKNGKIVQAFAEWDDPDAFRVFLVREDENGLVIVSEPLDHTKANWQEVPRSCALVARKGQPTTMRCMDKAMALAA